MHDRLPKTAMKYKETREFTEKTVPKGLLADHSTAEGVLGLIVILDGQLEYTRIGQGRIAVTPDRPAVVYPAEKHHVTFSRPVRFKVEFYRVPE
ncbi:MAG: DUF1971 domain-containing protein [Pseudomonadota bacterium]